MITTEVALGLIYSSITLLTPILLAGLAELLVERSGILNLSLEGTMLMGAFVAFMVAFYTGNLSYATLVASIAGAVLCLLFAFLTITLALDQMVTGLALNLLTIGITSYLYRASFGWYVSPIPPHIEMTLHPIDIPVLSQIPIVGKILFNHLPHTYAAFTLVLLSWWLLFRTKNGLKIRAIGEDPQTADYLGINVNLTRYVLLVLEGCVAGLAGSLLSIGYYNMFLDNMTQGRGYIAIALVILSRWNPLLLLGGTFLFSFVDAFQLRIQAFNVPFLSYQFALMLPYLFTIILLLVAGRKVKGPASLAKPFKKLR
ncbi:MAG: ABC transporter permease [Nitrososphaerota archaeon]|nr:ABC transporter permease [Aigarchaeota archaeon]MDW8077199.1 ABC transporter permease [Nitrososphaerota archaeon]